VKVKIELEMDWADMKMIDMISNQLELDPEATIRFLMRKGIQSLMQPPAPETKEKKRKGDKK